MANGQSASSRRFRRKRKRLMSVHGDACYYCECELSLVTDAENFATFEHLTKSVDGGTFDDSNIVLACKPCNSSRGDYSPEVWRLISGRIIGLYKEKHRERRRVKRAWKTYNKFNKSVNPFTHMIKWIQYEFAHKKLNFTYYIKIQKTATFAKLKG